MNRRLALAAVAVAALLVAVTLTLLLGRERVAPATKPAAVGDVPTPLPAVEDGGETTLTSLYFPGDDELLHAEVRELPPESEPALRARSVLEALFAGPDEEGLWPLFYRLVPEPPAEGDGDGEQNEKADPAEAEDLVPELVDVQLSSFHLGDDGVAFVDLTAEGSADPPLEGSTEELLGLYGLVTTVVANVPGTRAVVVLWNGRQRVTFAGHLDTSRPLAPRPDLIAD